MIYNCSFMEFKNYFMIYKNTQKQYKHENENKYQYSYQQIFIIYVINREISEKDKCYTKEKLYTQNNTFDKMQYSCMIIFINSNNHILQ